MVDPKTLCLFITKGLSPFKNELFERVGKHLQARGGKVIRYDAKALMALPREIVPILGCMPEITDLIQRWRKKNRPRVQWDRGYARRVFATWLPRGESGGYYRWHVNAFQLATVRPYPDDRWKALGIPLQPWAKGGRHVVVAAPTPNYASFHGIQGWYEKTLRELVKLTDRQIVIRDKESKRPLQADLEGAHCLVAHGSITATEAAILGCPVFDHPESAAALVGLTDLKKIETPIYPDRQPWANALAYSQFNERELIDGTLWRLLE